MCSSRYASCLWSAGKTWPHCKPISAWKHRARSRSQWQACVRSHRRSISMRRQLLRYAEGGSSSAAIGPCEGMTGSIFCRRIFVTSKQANATTFCGAGTDSSALGMNVLTSATSVSEPHSGPVVFRLQASIRSRSANVRFDSRETLPADFTAHQPTPPIRRQSEARIYKYPGSNLRLF